jgi:PleD family two-component response regulator
VESELGRGSLFYFSIPFQFEADKEAKQFSPFVNLKGMKSLVVDDNDTARETLKSYLDSFGFQTSVAGTGEEALSIITAQEQENPFRLILLDHCDLPGFFGPLNS